MTVRFNLLSPSTDSFSCPQSVSHVHLMCCYESPGTLVHRHLPNEKVRAKPSRMEMSPDITSACLLAAKMSQIKKNGQNCLHVEMRLLFCLRLVLSFSSLNESASRQPGRPICPTNPVAKLTACQSQRRSRPPSPTPAVRASSRSQ